MLAVQGLVPWMRAELEQIFRQKSSLMGGARLEDCRSLGGGCSQSAWQLQFSDGRVLFAKQGTEAMLEAERLGLQALNAAADPRDLMVPKPLALLRAEASQALLVLPWLDQTGGDQEALGRGLAKLHRHSMQRGPGRYGWSSDGYIGLGPQPGGWRDSWGEAYVQLRLCPQLRLAKAWGLELPSKAWLEVLTQVLEEHSPAPSLVHGDLWGGNAAVLADGRGALIDPASWWADREVDLAMTHLFGGFSQGFYSAYEQEWPLAFGASDRIEVYNLYHLLNHANLFGGGYRQQCRQSIRLLKQRFD